MILRLGLLACLPVVAAPAIEGQEWQAFTRTLDAFASADSVVGAGAVILRDGEVVARHHYGDGDRALRQPVDEQTIFHWGSITKTLTAIAVMQLRDRGRLSLDDRITTWIPELRQMHNRFGSADSITLRMLLSHTAGFQNPTWPYRRGRAWEPFEPTRWEQLVAMMPYQEVGFRPGSRYGYSNPAFIYLARVIEHVTGDPYQSYIQKNIWTPLGMTRSYFGATPWHLAAERSNNYTLVRDSSGTEAIVANGREFDPGITIPNGGWNAPLTDLATYAAFLTGETASDTARARIYDTVLKRASLREMWQPAVQVRSDGSQEAMGLSFFLFGEGDAQIVGHTGEQAGFRSFLLLNPRTSTTVIAAFNTTNDVRSAESGQGFTSVLRAGLTLVRE